MYENIYNEDFDLNMFVEEYKQVICETPLFEYEIAILKDTCGYTYMENTHVNLKQDKCIICDNQFENIDALTNYPICKHPFHSNC